MARRGLRALTARLSTSAVMSEGEREKDGLAKYIRRFKTVLRRGSSARVPEASPPDLSAADHPPAAVTARYVTHTGIILQSILKSSGEPSTTLPPVQDVPESTTAEPIRNQTVISVPHDARVTGQYDRLRAMFAKYNMDFDDSTWPARPERQQPRVEKPIRMRVRIICHYCRTNYSASRECTSCQHRRCEKCTRVPPKDKRKGKEREPDKAAEEKGEEIGAPATGVGFVSAAEVDAGELSAGDAEDEAEGSRSAFNTVPKRAKRRKEIPLILPSRTGGQDLVRKEQSQRVHRTCCTCQRSFVRDSKCCSRCRHMRCARCPRVPPKLDKWPDGYPGDVIPAEPERIPRQWKKPRVRVRWTCHQCRKLFMEGEYRCANCSHSRCTDCEREPPRRVRQPLNAEAVTSVQERLTAVSGPAKTSELVEESTVASPCSKEA